MLKTVIIASAVIFGVAAPTTPLAGPDPTTAEHTILNLPDPDTVIAQFSYLEISHGADGFDFSVTDKTAVFVDFEFPGDLHVRIGF